jgi:hypothetical protein
MEGCFMKRNFVVLFIMFSIFAWTAAFAASGKKATPKQPDAGAVIKKVRGTIKALKSYSYKLRCLNDGDEFVVARHKAALKSYEAILSKIELLTRKKMSSDAKAIYESISEVQFISPFITDVSLDKDDYLPPLIQGAHVFYRPDINEEEVFVKEPLVGLVFRKMLKDNDSGVGMVINWTYFMLEIDCALANGGKASVTSVKDDQGMPEYKLEIEVKKGAVPWRAGCGGENYGIPEPAKIQANRELETLEQRINKYKKDKGVMTFWIDAKTWLPVRRETRFGKKLVTQQWITGIQLNKVKKSDLLEAK